MTVIAPDGESVLNLQELAEKAWCSLNKEITLDRVVKVWAFGR
ncbi:hypothetical protein [Nordella sp. HKS 07]|nr:hypothetical protein [Nordella sp. HKS 07]